MPPPAGLPCRCPTERPERPDVATTRLRSTQMRDSYHDALDGVTDQLVTMTRMVGSMIERASAALLEADLAKAESVIAADEEVDTAEVELELRCTELLALQQPVATDLRLVTGALRMSATIERMGDLA